ncbi:MAG TPA: tryptophan--tRNA ligase [Candidatus Competibacteraceae bacterium]|nr:MAG: tryptophan--tRNA ligase [Candidatus Competibacteraceae bacterium]HOB61665.1 tryptophan--tRNA ligase [Candidatus Competibacteraceae bacterium]HQA25160.1 tryptophan--tRNA ligase [Candidatus Competibacteraceae bacterium]HQD57256.1 tryptophan--tRNA ligase [Candidatus Competibacteraceae bacterium]
MEITLTGITTTGTPHLGNYVGAILPAIEASRRTDVQSFYFLADYHALVKCHDPALVHRSRLEVAATWLALGLDVENVIFYAQTDIPEILELSWILTCVTAKGLMNRAHAYKAAVAENMTEADKDPDKGVTMGLFCYPILMAADILMFNAHKVPVGRDQIQHLEMARDIAARFNHFYGEHFVLPEAVVDDKTAVLVGLDGRKMSKSYGNTIPLFEPEKALRKLIMRIKTNSLPPEAPKDPDGCTLFQIYQAFATTEETAALRARYASGIGWGEVKQMLFEYLNERLSEPRQRYHELLAQPTYIEQILKQGAVRAREYSAPFLHKLRHAVGIRPLQK